MWNSGAEFGIMRAEGINIVEMNEEQSALFLDLTTLQQQVCLNKILGMSNTRAYLAADGTAKNYQSAAAVVSVMLKDAKVAAFMKSVALGAANEVIMSRDEMAERLSVMARTNVGDVLHLVTVEDELLNIETGEVISGSAHWMLKPIEEMSNGGILAINEVKKTKDGLSVKLQDQAAAMKQLANIMGYDAPVKSEISGPGGGPIEIAEMTDEDFQAHLLELGVVEK